MKVLVTGAAGFVGSWVTKRLLGEGHEVVGLDVASPAEAWRIGAMGLEKMDYRWGSVEDVTADQLPPHVIHCASTTNVKYAAENPHHAIETTVAGTVSLLEAAIKAPKMERFVLMSSHSIYGSQEVQPIEETAEPRPTNLYGALKVCQEQVALSYLRSFDLPVTIARSAMVFGPYERAGALVRIFLERALANETITVTGNGEQSRDMNYIENTVDGLMLLLEKEDAVGGIFNIGSGESVSILDLAKNAIRTMKSKAQIKFIADRPGEEGKMRLDIFKAGKGLGYRPKVTFQDGILRAAEWVWDRQKKGVILEGGK